MSPDSIAKFRPFDKVECCFDIVAVFGNNVERNFVLSSKSKQIKHKRQHCRRKLSTLLPKNGKHVEATFDTVERIVQLVAFDNVAWTLLLVWTSHKAAVITDGYGHEMAEN